MLLTLATLEFIGDIEIIIFVLLGVWYSFLFRAIGDFFELPSNEKFSSSNSWTLSSL